MPPIFKALVSITVLLLFIGGVMTTVWTTVDYYANIGMGNPPELSTFIGWGLGSVQFVLVAVVTKLRQMLE